MSSEASVNEQPQQQTSVPTPARLTPAPRGHWVLWSFLVVLIVGIIGAAAVQHAQRINREPLPPVIKDAPAFLLTDDNGTTFSSQLLAGKPYVIDFIFTRCGGQCPLMTVQMRDLQRWLKDPKNNFDLNLVSVTVDPENDTPKALAEYAERFKAEKGNWKFLTGPREETYPLIQNGFLLGVEENQGKPTEEQFIHSDRFVLVDASGKIRGFFSATDEEQMKRLRRVIWSMMKPDKE